MDLNTAIEKVIDYFTNHPYGCIYGNSGVPLKGVVGAILSAALGIVEEEKYYDDLGEPTPKDVLEALDTIFSELQPYADGEYQLDVITTAYLLTDKRTGKTYTLIRKYYMEDADDIDIVICLEEGKIEFD